MRRLLIAVLCLCATTAGAQMSGPPAGGPTGQFIGPPEGRLSDFLGSWVFTYQGPPEFRCPCEGTITITKTDYGDLHGIWKPLKGPAIRMSGPTGYNQNVWIGTFEQAGDVDFPLKGHFRMEARGGGQLTGSYQPDGTAIPYTWQGQR